jgi:hypothetical protein
MSIVVSQNFVLSSPNPYGLTTDHPVIGWQNVVAVDTIVATSAATGYPVTNLANPATHLRWRATTAVLQYLTVTTGSADDFDYVGIARHNLSSENIAVSIEADAGAGFVELTAPTILPNDGPALFRFTAAPYTAIRAKLAAGDDVAEIATLFVGKLLVLPRRLYQGFTPLSYGRAGKEINAMAESGDDLGTITTQRHVESKMPLTLIDPTYQRTYIEPFLAARPPFFLAWRPATYPNEVGYGRLTNWPQPTPQSPHSLLSYSLEMRGAA